MWHRSLILGAVFAVRLHDRSCSCEPEPAPGGSATAVESSTSFAPVASTSSSSTGGSSSPLTSNDAVPTTSGGTSEGSTPAGSTTQLPPDLPKLPEGCGNGTLDPGEVCDKGVENNLPPGVTETDEYEACTYECDMLINWCGDGVWQDEYEACELNQLVPSSGLPCSAQCTGDVRIIFATRETFRGGDIMGIEGAHARCQAAADEARKKFESDYGGGFPNPWVRSGTPKTFKAWISDGTPDDCPARWFREDPKDARPYHLLGEPQRVAESAEALLLKGPEMAIDRDEDGVVIAEIRRVWTNVAPSGHPLSTNRDCKSWTFTSEGLVPCDEKTEECGCVGFTGGPDWKSDWSVKQTDALASCAQKARLYCLEHAPSQQMFVPKPFCKVVPAEPDNPCAP